MEFLRYLSTGEVTGTGDADSEAACLMQVREGETVEIRPIPEWFRDSTHMRAEDGGLVERPKLAIDPEYTITADGADEVVLPVTPGTIVRHNDELYTVDDFAFTSEMVGTYYFRIKPPFPHQATEVLIHAV